LLGVFCSGATLMVLASGAYLRGGAAWFAAAWWIAFSLGLMIGGERTARESFNMDR
jgi:hypothetical protein